MKPLRLAGFSRAELLFSLKSFGAAMLALYIASRAGLPRPFWAVMTTYIVAHPLAGNVRSKALFRFCGTLLGCTATLLIVPSLSNAPLLLSGVLALWVGGCLYLSQLDRTARSYVFMLAGYTAALIGFPSVDAPQALFDTASARVEEIGLGILCATLVHSLVLPTTLAPSILSLLDRSLQDAQRWLADLLQAGRSVSVAPNSLRADHQRLAADITQLRLMSLHVPFDTGALRWAAGTLQSLQDRLSLLAPTLSAVEDRLQALSDFHHKQLPVDVVRALADIECWQQDQARPSASGPDALVALRQRLSSLAEERSDEHPPASLWERALRQALATGLDELVQGWQQCSELRRELDAALKGRPARHATRTSRRPQLHLDPWLALRSSAAAVTAIALCCLFWIATGWPSGSVAAMMAAVFCSFFATLDDPVPAIQGFLKFTLWSMPIAALYVLVVLPAVRDYATLALACAPTFLVLGAFAARPGSVGAALPMLIGVASALALHDTASADFLSFLNSNLAQVIGIGVAAIVSRAMRSVSADWTVRRIRQAMQQELARLAAPAAGRIKMPDFAARTLDRIGLLGPRLLQAEPGLRGTTAESSLRELRLGADILSLQALSERLPTARLAGLMQTLRQHLHANAGSQSLLASGDDELLRGLDSSLHATLQDRHAAADERKAATAALVGLRRSLFPSALPLSRPAEKGLPT